MARTKGSSTLRTWGNSLKFRFGYRFAVAHMLATRKIDRWLDRDTPIRTAADQAVLIASLRPRLLMFNPSPQGEETDGKERRRSPVNPADRASGRFELKYDFDGDPPGRAAVRREGERVSGRLLRLDEATPTHPDRIWLEYTSAIWIILTRHDIAKEHLFEIIQDLFDADPAPFDLIIDGKIPATGLLDLCTHATRENNYWVSQQNRLMKAIEDSQEAESIFKKNSRLPAWHKQNE